MKVGDICRVDGRWDISGAGNCRSFGWQRKWRPVTKDVDGHRGQDPKTLEEGQDLQGLWEDKSPGLPLLGVLLRRTGFGSSCVATAPRINGFMEPDIRDSAMGILGSNQSGNLVWLWEWGVQGLKQGTHWITGDGPRNGASVPALEVSGLWSLTARVPWMVRLRRLLNNVLKTYTAFAFSTAYVLCII